MDMASHSSTSLEDLESMRASGKLSQHDYDALRAAMEADSGKRARPEPMPGARPVLRKSWANRQLGGVCAGLGEWMGIEPWIVRIGFIIAAVLTGGTAFIVYLVLYAVIPWNESERHDVPRFSYRFAAGVIGLWLGLQGFLYLTALHTVGLFSHAGFRLPAISRVAIKLGEQDGVGIAIQVCVLLAAVFVYAMAPAASPLRKIVAGVTVVCILMVFVIAILGSAIAIFQLGGYVRR